MAPDSYLGVGAGILLISLFNYIIKIYIGYRAVGFVFLLAIVTFGPFLRFGTVILASTLSALIWNFFFIPPQGTFTIHAPEDVMMVITYFVIAVTTGLFSTQLKKNETMIRKQNEAERHAKILTESEKLLRTLLDGISHELKTPLTAIMGAATTLQSQHDKQPNEDSIYKELLKEIVSSSERLNYVFENMLDMTRLESNVIHLKREWFDVLELIQFSIDRQSKRVVQHTIRFYTEEEPIYVHGDFTILEHALSNLLLNAASYSPEHSKITLSAKKQEGVILIAVQDQGSGIPEEYIPRVFDKFFRLHATLSGGLGLGLSIAKNWVELHGGTITVKNNSDQGAVFTIQLPYVEPPSVILDSAI